MESVIHLHGSNSPMPKIGLGTWQAKQEELEVAVNTALSAGYRHIDTAFNYNNEEILGKILAKSFAESKIKRSEIFITTKLPHIGNRKEDVEKFLKLSLERLQLDYIDLYLVHVPFGFLYDTQTFLPKTDEGGNILLDIETDHIAVWKEMERLVEKGLVRNIGLSNFNKNQIENICVNAKIMPQVLQIECHPYMQQNELRNYCLAKNIIVTAYSPLGSPGAKHHFLSKYNYNLKNAANVLENSVITEIAANLKKTPSQIILRYLLQKNIVVIPKSSNPTRITENINIFDFNLNSDELNSIENIDKGSAGRIIDFNFWKGCERHPCYPF